MKPCKQRQETEIKLMLAKRRLGCEEAQISTTGNFTGSSATTIPTSEMLRWPCRIRRRELQPHSCPKESPQ